MEYGKIQAWDEEFAALVPQLQGPENRGNRIYAATKSFKFFLFIYMSHFLTIKPAHFHIQSWEDAFEPRSCQLWFRGSGKSIVWSVCYPLWKLLCNPDQLDLKWEKYDIFCISKTSSLVEKWIRFQKRELTENNRIKADFDPKAGEIWRNDEYEIEGRGRVRAIGVGSQFRGEHPTDAILDDIEDREEAKVESNRDKLREWFYGDFLGALRMEEDKTVRVKIIGNCVHPLGIMQELYNLDWWKSTKYAVYEDDGLTPSWPEYMTAEKIEELRKQIPEPIFMAEYMNSPIVSENPVFMRKQFNAYEPGMIRDGKGNKIGIRDMILITSHDPAISTRDGSDYSAITTWGVVPDERSPRIYCLEARRGHWSMGRQITELLATYERFPGTVQLIETVGGFEALYQEYRDRLERECLNVKVHSIKPNKDKGVRANAITHLFEKGYVYFDHSDKMQKILMDELALFDYSVRKHGRDDFVDSTTQALSYADDVLRRRKKKTKRRTLNLAWEARGAVYGRTG